jgi:hypothetical protein
MLFIIETAALGRAKQLQALLYFAEGLFSFRYKNILLMKF